MKRLMIIFYKAETDEQKIKDQIKLLGEWFNYFQGSYLVVTSLTSKQIYERIGTNKTSDRFLVTEIVLKDYFGFLPKEAWEWLQKRKSIL